MPIKTNTVILVPSLNESSCSTSECFKPSESPKTCNGKGWYEGEQLSVNFLYNYYLKFGSNI
jgi:hypothetical protein